MQLGAAEVQRVGACPPVSAMDLRARLREATSESHARMHRHSGFAAAAQARMDRRAYADLLARLYGFHRSFEQGFSTAPVEMAGAIDLHHRARSAALARDLRNLGFGGALETLPLCAELPLLESEPQWLGALYVTEGSTLGGAVISRALALAGYSPAQRGFFEGYGERRSGMWRSFLARLETHADNPVAAAEAQGAAQAMFAAFESWLGVWRGAIESRD